MADKTAKQKQTREKKTHPVLHGIGLLLAILFAVLVMTVSIIYNGMGGLFDTFAANMFSRPGSDIQGIMSSADVEAQLQTEGTVLLQNRDSTLPLSADVKKVNVFGWASTQWLGGGSGSGGVTRVDTDLLKALSDYGIETNEELTQMYRDFQDKREYTETLNSYPEQSSRLYEPSISDPDYYPQALLDNARAYSDTAIVVIGRLCGESNDAAQEQYKRVTKGGEIVVDETRTSLELSTEEEELLTYVGANYENVIVILNSGNVLEMGQVETIPGVDALVMAGETGTNGAAVLPALLYGEQNFSGRTADTWAYDFTTAASYANAGMNGVGAYTDADGSLYPLGVTNGNLGVDDVYYDRVSYVDYAENIYVGYKWYETADAEGYWDAVRNAYGTGYDGVVQYPFGYGLSYTSFDWEVTEAPAADASFGKDDTLEITVRVTNTGDRAGKDVVELYYDPPYTAGGIEKASANLADFAKTDLLQPGESQDVTLRVSARDMASYDAYDANGNGFAGYEAERGAYRLLVNRDAHRAEKVLTVQATDDLRFETDPVTGAEVSNKFTGEDAMDGVALDGSDSGQDIKYLTRADFAGTFPAERAADRPMTDKAASLNLFTEETAGEQTVQLTTGAKNGLRVTDGAVLTELGYRLGKDYDDPQWEALLDQLTREEMVTLVSSGYASTAALKSIGKPATSEVDGPSQVGGFYGNPSTTGFSSGSTNACTWNRDLLGDLGFAMGREAAASGMNGIYAPSMNIHRSPLNGRNYEYYSEDGVLSGELCGSFVAGAKKTGLYVFIKHFINNDGESGIYRDSVYLWETEQGLREIYLRPFEIAIGKYGATGLMSAYNRVGAVWAGGSRALLTGILRDEWGFKGVVITDFSDHHEYMNGDQMLRAGGDLWMAMAGILQYDTQSDSMQQALRTASKHVIYQYLNALAENRDYVEETGLLALKVQVRHGTAAIRKFLYVLYALAILFFLLALRGIARDMRIRRSL